MRLATALTGCRVPRNCAGGGNDKPAFYLRSEDQGKSMKFSRVS
jgi:hypothetical protein